MSISPLFGPLFDQGPNNGPLVKAAAISRLQRSLGGGNDPMVAMSLVISQS